MNIELIKREEVYTSQWSGGVTNEYIIYPKHAVYADRDFMFRISSATIESVPSEFTKFNNYRRYLVMLEGDLKLIRNNKKEYYENNTLFAFESNDEITSYSAGKDFNLMLHHSIVDEVVMISSTPFTTERMYLCIFSLKAEDIIINGQVYNLAPYDCLIIYNRTLEFINVKLSADVLVAYW